MSSSNNLNSFNVLDVIHYARSDDDGKRSSKKRDVPQNYAPQPGSYQACVGNLGATGFSQEAADLINKINGAEGTSRDLLAVTWMNENAFRLRPAPNTNGYDGDYKTEGYMHWDVGPFHINIGYTFGALADKSVNFKGLTVQGVFGYTFYDPSGKTPTTTFDGVPLENGQTTPPHLHFWIKLNGVLQDPEVFLNQACPP